LRATQRAPSTMQQQSKVCHAATQKETVPQNNSADATAMQRKEHCDAIQ